MSHPLISSELPGLNQAFLYQPGHTGDLSRASHLATFQKLETAAQAVLDEYFRGR